MVNTPLQLTGIGLRAAHYAEILEKRPTLAWLEVHSENYFGDSSQALHYLEQIRTIYPISMHGVGMSLGSSDDLNWQYLQKLRGLVERVKPCLISEHLSWSSLDGQYYHDLLPLPYTQECLDHLIPRIKQVQDYLGRQIILENISHYLKFNESNISETEFLNQLALQSGCGLLLDINNLYVNSINFHFDPYQYLKQLASEYIQEFHLGGFSICNINDKDVLIDTHSRPVVPAVWDLFREACNLFGVKPTIVEWDKDVPTLETLCLEAFRAEKIMREKHVTQLTA